MIRVFLTLLASGALAAAVAAQDEPVVPHQAPAPFPEAASGLSARDAVVLGVVEGITEFLPISSTGHLIITNRVLGLDSEEPMRDANGELLWFKAPTESEPGVPLTLKLAADTYIIVIQIGAIAAVLLVFWPRIVAILRGLLGRDAAGLRLLRNLILAVVPVVVVGLALDDWIETNLFSVGTVVAALISGAVLMLAAERWRRKRFSGVSAGKDPSELTPREALTVGAVQCLALWPGMSRSMVTMVGGYFVGLAPARAAEFAFLIGLPVLGGAALYKGLKSGTAMLAVFGWFEMILGAVVAAVAAFVAVRFLVAYLSRYGLEVFAFYRILLAVLLISWFLL